MAKKQQKVPTSDPKLGFIGPDPANYPPGELPVLTSEELNAICETVKQGQLPTGKELDDALSEQRRAPKKITAMADIPERVLSAVATVTATLTLGGLAIVGRDYRQCQRTKAGGPRRSNSRYLNAAILEELAKQPDATAREIWDALSQYEENDLTIVEDKGKGLLRWHFYGDPECNGTITFKTFKTRVSRLKKPLLHG